MGAFTGMRDELEKKGKECAAAKAELKGNREEVASIRKEVTTLRQRLVFSDNLEREVQILREQANDARQFKETQEMEINHLRERLLSLTQQLREKELERSALASSKRGGSGAIEQQQQQPLGLAPDSEDDGSTSTTPATPTPHGSSSPSFAKQASSRAVQLVFSGGGSVGDCSGDLSAVVVRRNVNPEDDEFLESFSSFGATYCQGVRMAADAFYEIASEALRSGYGYFATRRAASRAARVRASSAAGQAGAVSNSTSEVVAGGATGSGAARELLEPPATSDGFPTATSRDLSP